MDDILNILRDYGTLLLVGQYPHGPLGGLAITLLLSFFGILLAFPFHRHRAGSGQPIRLAAPVGNCTDLRGAACRW